MRSEDLSRQDCVTLARLLRLAACGARDDATHARYTRLQGRFARAARQGGMYLLLAPGELPAWLSEAAAEEGQADGR